MVSRNKRKELHSSTKKQRPDLATNKHDTSIAFIAPYNESQISNIEGTKSQFLDAYSKVCRLQKQQNVEVCN